MAKIFSPRRKFRRDLDCLEQFYLINFAKNERIFLDSQEKSHEVTWKSSCLEKFLSFMRAADAEEKIFSSQRRKKNTHYNKNLVAQNKSTIEEFQNEF